MARRLAGELAFCGFLGGVGVLALSGLQGLTKSPFDYMGSAEVPRALAWMLIVLAVLVALNVIRAAINTPDGAAQSDADPDDLADPDPAEGKTGPRQQGQTALVTLATLLYILSILWSAIPYSLSTTVFLSVAMIALTPARHRRMAIILPLAVFIGALGEYVFVSVLLLPFPGW
ncbi:MAG: tripartite tricarboxylate transporter TctB family protein [Pseudomonadota bacterium]